MKVPYFHILALTLFRCLTTARAAPPVVRADNQGVTLGAAANLPDTVRHMVTSRDVPVHFMQGNSDQTRPPVPVDNYKTDVDRLLGGAQ
ncbi:hypothetical protein BD413DRAFT_611045 [Trametes elegans]|nr:hypothetical protein BD413DRAFT_611045 [Trametes elegans]